MGVFEGLTRDERKHALVACVMSENGSTLLMNYSGALIMILSSFLFGFLTLKLFLDLSKKISFDKFMIGFGIIAIAAVLIGYLL